MLFKYTLGYGKFFSPDGDSGGGSAADADGDDAGGDGDASGSGDGTGEDVSGLKSALEAERAKARTAEKDLRAIRKELDTLKNAGKSDDEQRDAALKDAQSKAEAAEARLKAIAGKAAVTAAAAKAHAISTSAVFALIKDDLDYDDDGEPTNVDALIARARKDEPNLFRAADGTADGGTKGKSAQGTDSGAISDMIRKAAGRG